MIVSNESIRIQLQFATNRIKIGPLKPEIQPAKGWATSLLWAYDVTWCHRPTAGNNIIFHTFYLFLTVEVHLQDTQEISGAQFIELTLYTNSMAQLPYRRRERRMFVIYSSAHQLCFIATYLGTWFLALNSKLLMSRFWWFFFILFWSWIQYTKRHTLRFKKIFFSENKKNSRIFIYFFTQNRKAKWTICQF